MFGQKIINHFHRPPRQPARGRELRAPRRVARPDDSQVRRALDDDAMTPRGESPSDDDVDDARDAASAEALLGLFMLVSALVYVDRGIASSAAVSGAPRSAREPAGRGL